MKTEIDIDKDRLAEIWAMPGEGEQENLSKIAREGFGLEGFVPEGFDLETVQAQAIEYINLRAKVEKMKKQLSKYCEKNGKIQLDTGALGHFTIDTKVLTSTLDLVNTLKANDIDEQAIWKYLKISRKDVDSLVGENEQLAKQVEALYTTKPQTCFEFRKGYQDETQDQDQLERPINNSQVTAKIIVKDQVVQTKVVEQASTQSAEIAQEFNLNIKGLTSDSQRNYLRNKLQDLDTDELSKRLKEFETIAYDLDNTYFCGPLYITMSQWKKALELNL